MGPETPLGSLPQLLRAALLGNLADPTQALPRWTPGQTVAAQVVEALPNGRFHVDVEGALMDMNLPQGQKAGDRLSLTVVSGGPRASFLMGDAAAGGAGRVLSSAPVSLSPAASLISNLQAVGGKPVGAVDPVVPSLPLLASPTGDPVPVAAALKHAVADSGLFYESHQADWVAGDRSLAAVLREPQGRLSPLLRERPGADGTLEVVISSRAGGETPPAAPDSGDGSGTRLGDAVHKDLMPLVQQQMALLDSRHILWRGELWPGLPMEWELWPETGGGAAEEASGGEAWSTRLRLDLPHLGQVDAVVSVDGNQARLRLSAADERSRQELAADLARLREGLARAGFEHAQVDADGPD